MNLLIVGSDKIFSIENFYAKHLRILGVDVCHFSAQGIFFDYYYKNLLNKIIFKTGLSSIYTTLNKKFKKEVAHFQPNIIWVFKGMEIFPESLQWAKDKNIKLVNYNPDNPFLFSGKGSDSGKISIPLKIQIISG